MKKILIALATSIIVSSCGITYYTYYEVDSPDMASTVSKQDARWSPSHKSPSKVIAVYPDSTGKTVYLIETVTKERPNQ